VAELSYKEALKLAMQGAEMLAQGKGSAGMGEWVGKEQAKCSAYASTAILKAFLE
jgi:hypothetical protein